jgi:hypothetical protein
MSREKITIRGPKQRWFNHDVFFHQKRLLKNSAQCVGSSKRDTQSLLAATSKTHPAVL